MRRVIMRTVGLRQMNQHFSRIMRAVRDGEEILITDRGKPVAVVHPVSQGKDMEERLQRLEVAGVLKRASRAGRIGRHPRILASGEPLSETVSRMRDERGSL
jgi:prevent-host-death family protein